MEELKAREVGRSVSELVLLRRLKFIDSDKGAHITGKLSAHENLSSPHQAQPFLTNPTSPTSSPVSGCSVDKFRLISEGPQAPGWFHVTAAAAHLKGVKAHEFRSQGVSAEGGG